MVTTKGVEIPADLAGVLRTDALTLAVFEGMRPSCQRRYAQWVSEAKSPATRARRIAKTAEAVLAYGRRHGKV
ncbi:MAG: YdeI/OmpD-associated family protein [Patescibacteria group bacterium]